MASLQFTTPEKLGNKGNKEDPVRIYWKKAKGYFIPCISNRATCMGWPFPRPWLCAKCFHTVYQGTTPGRDLVIPSV